MTLSERAVRYFNSLERSNKWVCDETSTIEYLKKQNLPLNKILIEIQSNFSGYKLTVKGRHGHYFLLNLFSKGDIKGNKSINIYRFENTYLLDFGEHEYAQVNFYITEFGELCTWGHEDEDKPNIICSSIEKFIEQYALQNELGNQEENEYYYNVVDNKGLTNLLKQDFDKIKECSDKYCQWYTNGQLTIVKGTWFDRSEFYLHVYGETKKNCDAMIDKLKLNKLIE